MEGCEFYSLFGIVINRLRALRWISTIHYKNNINNKNNIIFINKISYKRIFLREILLWQKNIKT